MDRIQLLLHMYEDQRAELAFRRSRENEIFVWTASVLLAFIGGSLLVSRDDHSFLLQTYWGAILASCALAAITVISVLWQLKQRQYLAGNQRMLVEIQNELGCFLKGQVSYPPEWGKWGHANVKFKERLWAPSKVAATVLIGLMSVGAALLAWKLPSGETQGKQGVQGAPVVQPSHAEPNPCTRTAGFAASR